MLKKRMSWLLAATMVASMGMGCVPAAAEESTYDGTIRWLNYKPEVADAMNENRCCIYRGDRYQCRDRDRSVWSV